MNTKTSSWLTGLTVLSLVVMFFVYTINLDVSNNASGIAQNKNGLDIAQEQQQTLAKGQLQNREAILQTQEDLSGTKDAVFNKIAQIAQGQGAIIAGQQGTIEALGGITQAIGKTAEIAKKAQATAESKASKGDIQQVRRDIGGQIDRVAVQSKPTVNVNSINYTNKISELIQAVKDIVLTASTTPQADTFASKYKVVANNLNGSITVQSILDVQKTGCSSQLLPQLVKDYVDTKAIGNIVYVYACDGNVWRQFRSAATNPWLSVNYGSNTTGFYVSQSPWSIAEVITEL